MYSPTLSFLSLCIHPAQSCVTDALSYRCVGVRTCRAPVVVLSFFPLYYLLSASLSIRNVGVSRCCTSRIWFQNTRVELEGTAQASDGLLAPRDSFASLWLTSAKRVGTAGTGMGLAQVRVSGGLDPSGGPPEGRELQWYHGGALIRRMGPRWIVLPFLCLRIRCPKLLAKQHARPDHARQNPHHSLLRRCRPDNEV